MKKQRKKFKILRDEVVFEGNFIRTIKRHFLDRAGHKIWWEMFERKMRGKRIVAIAALTPKRELILEKAFRLPFKNYVIELPAGLMDKEKESEKSAIRRELLEETGYSVSELRLLTHGVISSGSSNDEMAIYFGDGALKVAEPKLECSEDIEVILVPIGELLSFIRKSQNRGLKVDLKIPAILPYLEKNGLSV